MPYLLLILTAAIWGSSWMAAGVLAREGTSPIAGALGRFAFGSFGLLLVVALRRNWPSPGPRLWMRLAAMGFFGVFLYNISFFSGLRTVPSGRASLMASLQPSVVFLFSALVWKEPVTARKILGLVLSLLGATVVLSQGDVQKLFAQGLGTGDVWILFTVVSWVCYTLIGRGVMQQMDTIPATAYGIWTGSLMLLLYAAILGTGSVDWSSPTLWLVSAYLGLAGTALAFVLYLQGVAKLGPSRASIFINLVPVFSVITSALYTGETITLATLLGGSLALSGVALLNK
jgi:drug/metabolite transporter (DMT)-like permease